MKSILAAFLTVALMAGGALAADTISMKKGVSFDHKAHKATLKKCSACHAGKPGKIEGFGKELAHAKGCKGCHVELKKGPVGCKDCHPQ